MKDFPFAPQDFLTSAHAPFIEGRYPYTYAADFICGHDLIIQKKLQVFCLDWKEIHSLSEAAAFMRKLNGGDEDYEHIAKVFADAYLIENHITKP